VSILRLVRAGFRCRRQVMRPVNFEYFAPVRGA
jgi:hypothetical protein